MDQLPKNGWQKSAGPTHALFIAACFDALAADALVPVRTPP